MLSAGACSTSPIPTPTRSPPTISSTATASPPPQALETKLHDWGDASIPKNIALLAHLKQFRKPYYNNCLLNDPRVGIDPIDQHTTLIAVVKETFEESLSFAFRERIAARKSPDEDRIFHRLPSCGHIAPPQPETIKCDHAYRTLFASKGHEWTTSRLRDGTCSWLKDFEAYVNTIQTLDSEIASIEFQHATPSPMPKAPKGGQIARDRNIALAAQLRDQISKLSEEVDSKDPIILDLRRSLSEFRADGKRVKKAATTTARLEATIANLQQDLNHNEISANHDRELREEMEAEHKEKVDALQSEIDQINLKVRTLEQEVAFAKTEGALKYRECVVVGKMEAMANYDQGSGSMTPRSMTPMGSTRNPNVPSAAGCHSSIILRTRVFAFITSIPRQI